MNKKALVLAMLAAFGVTSQAVMAEEKGAGCGIGKVILDGKSSKGANIAAAILNDILIPRTFFMSTAATMGEEILGCDPTKTVMKEEQQKRFVAANMDSLSRDMAQGQGMHLEALAAVMGIEASDRTSFMAMTKDEYATLFPSAQASADDVVASLQVAMLSRPDLEKYVQ